MNNSAQSWRAGTKANCWRSFFKFCSNFSVNGLYILVRLNVHMRNIGGPRAPCYFGFIRREHASRKLIEQLEEVWVGVEETKDNVIFLLKQYISDTKLSQPPCLILPGCFPQRLPSRTPTTMPSNNEMKQRPRTPC